MDLMFHLVSEFKKNKELKKIAIALDCAYAIGAIRHESISTMNISDDEMIKMIQAKFDRLGIKTSITVDNLKGNQN